MSRIRSGPSVNKERGRAAEGEQQTQVPSAHKTNPSMWLRPVNPVKSRILIVHDDDTIAKHLEIILLHAGLASARVKSMKEACEYARSGSFQVVVTTPALSDGSWKRLGNL
jgi:PleD family two-component response regulator